MSIRLIDIDKESELYDTAQKKNSASIFNSINWLKLYKPYLQVLGIYNNNNELIGSFYLFTKTKFGIEFFITPPFTPHNGLFFENRAENKSNINSVNKTVIREIADYLKGIKSKLLLFSLPSTFIETQPFIWNDLNVKVKYTYQIDLSQSESSLLSNLSSEKRKSLNKAKLDQLEIVLNWNFNEVKNVILKTFSRKQITKNRIYFDKILLEFANEQNSFAFTAYQNGIAIATTFCVYDQSCAYFLFGGYDSEIKHHGAGVSCMWQSILHAKGLGIAKFDFEGSMIPEVEKYFREFGGTLTPYYQISKVKFPLTLINKTKNI